MARTNIDIDEDACREIMDRYQLATKREAVNLALRRLVGEALDLDDARSLRGSGWDGAEVLHSDVDFAVLERHTELRNHPDSGS